MVFEETWYSAGMMCSIAGQDLPFILDRFPGKLLYSMEYEHGRDFEMISIVPEPCHLILPDHGPWTE
jgi:hypothetical protein